MGKSRKLILTVKEFNKEDGVTDYNINGIDNVKALYFVRYPQGQFEDLPKGDYEVIQDSNNQTLRIKNAELLNRAERFQIGYLFDFSSSKYEVDFGADVNILKDRYNELVVDVEEIFKYIKENMMGADGQDVDTILPQLDTDEVWVKTETGYRGLNIGNLEENIKEMLKQIEDLKKNIFREMIEAKDKHIAEIDGRFEQEVLEGQRRVTATGNEQVERVTQTGDAKNQLLINTFEEKNSTLIQTGDTKNQLLIDTFNEKNSALIQTGTAQNNQLIQTGTAQTGLVTAEGDKQVKRVTAQGDIEVQRVIDAGVTGKVNRTGDTMTGTLTINEPSAVFAINNAENGFSFLESSPQRGLNVYLGGVGTRWFEETANQGFWRGGATDIATWGISKNGSRVIHYDFGSSEFVVPNFKATGKLDVRAYADFYATINARTARNSKIMSLGVAGSWSESARSNSGFHVGRDGGALEVPNGTFTFTKGFQIETVTVDLGYVSRTSIGHLRSGTANWGSTVIYFEGDVEGQDAKHWWFHHTNGQFETNQLRVSGVSEFNNAMYSTAPSMLISNVTGMHVHSNSGLIGFLNSSGNWIFNVDGGGNMTSTSNVTAFSDIKLKKDLEVIPNAIEKIQAINGYTYTRKDTGERQAGVVAQEIKNVLPEVVKSNKDEKGEETLSVAYGNIVALLIEGIKEQQKEIDELKTLLREKGMI